ncbi:MAG TPA: Tim44/TimA family putative adaptor protein [Methylocella sp.]|nr:Tim44/TimA family putative adaptor protein [Methylocella sp.]
MTTIIFALLAAFVVWKLRSVLGTRNGTEKPPINPFTSRAPRSLGPRPGDPSREPSSRVIPLPGAAEPPVAFRANPNERWKPYAEPGSNAWSGLDSIAAADPAFNVASFINGAKAAYEMIIAAFASGDRLVLRNLLSPEVFESFTTVLEQREKRGEKVTTTIVSINKVFVEGAALREKTAEIKVHFTSEMISATRDQAGQIVEGSADRAVPVDDIWTFIRDVGSGDPNWKLAATETAH